MPNSPSSINLATGKQIPFFDKFVNWALTAGRLIVIFTEIVAVAAFIYRFSLDNRLVDLHEKIKDKQTLISLLKQDENKYRNLQDRITLASTFSTKSTKINTIIHDINDLIPKEILVNDLTLNIDKINLSLSIASTSLLTNFINLLKDYPEIKSISIDSIENKPSLGLLVNITASLR